MQAVFLAKKTNNIGEQLRNFNIAVFMNILYFLMIHPSAHIIKQFIIIVNDFIR